MGERLRHTDHFVLSFSCCFRFFCCEKVFRSSKQTHLSPIYHIVIPLVPIYSFTHLVLVAVHMLRRQSHPTPFYAILRSCSRST